MPWALTKEEEEEAVSVADPTQTSCPAKDYAHTIMIHKETQNEFLS
jgi:hypothetical protein